MAPTGQSEMGAKSRAKGGFQVAVEVGIAAISGDRDTAEDWFQPGEFASDTAIPGESCMWCPDGTTKFWRAPAPRFT